MDKTAERIKQLREERGYTLEQGAAIVGVAKSTLHRWEAGYTGRVSRGNIKTLADHYGVSPLWIMGISDDREDKGIDALEEDIIRMFRELDNKQKITLYNMIKISYEALNK